MFLLGFISHLPHSLPPSVNYHIVFCWDKSVFKCFYGWKCLIHLSSPDKTWHLKSYKSRWAKSWMFFHIPLTQGHNLSLTTCAFQTLSWGHELRKLLLFKLEWFYLFDSVHICWACTLQRTALYILECAHMLMHVSWKPITPW